MSDDVYLLLFVEHGLGAKVVLIHTQIFTFSFLRLLLDDNISW